MSESLNSKVAVISGASSGFAKATAQLFAQKDQCNLVIFDIDEKGLIDTADNCTKSGSKVISFKGDATKLGTFEKALKACLDNFGKVDFLINYAGGAVRIAPIEEMDDEINKRLHWSFCANNWAVAFEKPEAAPVITATFPLNDSLII